MVSLNLMGPAIFWACVCDNNHLCGKGDARKSLASWASDSKTPRTIPLGGITSAFA